MFLFYLQIIIDICQTLVAICKTTVSQKCDSCVVTSLVVVWTLVVPMNECAGLFQ